MNEPGAAMNLIEEIWFRCGFKLLWHRHFVRRALILRPVAPAVSVLEDRTPNRAGTNLRPETVPLDQVR